MGLKYEIDFRSLFSAGLVKLNEAEGLVFLLTGKQGSGKSFAAVRYAATRPRPRTIANFHLVDAEYATFNDILAMDTSNSLVIIDEIFKFYVKGDRVDKRFLSWLAQSRKNNRIVILIAQEYLETPLPLRRFARYLVNCRKVGPLIFETWSDGWTLHYDSFTSEYVADAYKVKVYKRTRSISSLYDTLELIDF